MNIGARWLLVVGDQQLLRQWRPIIADMGFGAKQFDTAIEALGERIASTARQPAWPAPITTNVSCDVIPMASRRHRQDGPRSDRFNRDVDVLALRP